MTLRVHPDDIVRESTSALLRIHPSWERVRLSDVAEVLNGFAFPSGRFSRTDGTPLLRIRDVGRSATDVRYSGEFDATYLVDYGDIVVGMDGDFRAARWAGRPALLNQRVCKLTVRDDDVYSSAFLLYVLPGYLDAIHAETSSVTVKHLSSRTIQDIPLPLPPIAEQHRIVAAIEEQFSRLAAAEGLLGGVARRLDQLRRSILTTTIDAGEWERSTVTEIASLVTDGDHNPPPRIPSGIPHLTARNVKRGRLVLDGCSFVSTDGFEQTRARYEPRAGDVIVTCVGTIGQTAVVPSDLQFSADRNLAAIRVQAGVNPRYVQLALSTPASQAMMSGASGSTAQPHLYLRDLRALSLPLPPIALQDRLAESLDRQLSVVDALAADIERALLRSAALRRSILERAFRGMLVPQDPAEEAATVLLGRIVATQASEPRPGRRRQTMSA